MAKTVAEQEATGSNGEVGRSPCLRAVRRRPGHIFGGLVFGWNPGVPSRWFRDTAGRTGATCGVPSVRATLGPEDG